MRRNVDVSRSPNRELFADRLDRVSAELAQLADEHRRGDLNDGLLEGVIVRALYIMSSLLIERHMVSGAQQMDPTDKWAREAFTSVAVELEHRWHVRHSRRG